jgi:hypothetical protein
MDYKELETALDNARPASFGTPTPAIKAAPALSSRDQGLLQGVAETLAPYLNKIEALEQRLVELERNQKTYLGVWKSDRQYSSMSEVTFDGARWYCCKSTNNKPGESADWVLMEKSEPTAHPRNGSAHGPPANPRFR